MKKILCAVLAAITISLTFASCASVTFSKSKTFKSDDGLSIKLNTTFEEGAYSKTDKVTYHLQSNDVYIFMLKQKFSDGFQSDPAQMSVSDYAKLVMEADNIKGCNILTDGDLVYIEYENETEVNGAKKLFYNAVFFYKGTDSFWYCDFGTLSSKRVEYRDKIFDWADTVEVN